MTAPLTYLKKLLVLLSSTLLIACHSGSSNEAPTPDVNTFHIYTVNQTIYSFDEETGISTQRGEFDEGDNKFLELNLDESKQGFEYAIYVLDNAIYLLNYDKDTNAQTIKLTEISEAESICGLIAKKAASNASYSDGPSSNRDTIDLPIVSIEYINSDTCDLYTNRRDSLNFASVIEASYRTSDIVKSAAKSEDVYGGLIIDYSSANSASFDDPEKEKGTTGFLGLDIDGYKLTLKYKIDEESDEWDSSFMTNTGIKRIQQVSAEQTLVQNDHQIFVTNTEKLFTINKEDSDIPIQNKIDSMFSTPAINLDNTNPIETNRHQNSDTFLIKHDNTLYYFESENFTQIPSNENQASTDSTKIKFDLTTDNTAFVVQETNNIQTLLAISTITGQPTTIISGQKVEFYIIENEVYVNTLEAQNDAGWQAHWFVKKNNIYTPKTYDNGRFIFAKDLREKYNTVYLLSSNSDITSERLIKPSLYKFDSSQSNGRKKGTSSSNSSAGFSFGQLNTDVSEVYMSIISNDIYGKIALKGINEDTNVGRAVEELYYFNPSQAQDDPEISEQSLLLMNRIEL